MLKFSLIEGFNKVIGLVITALIARLLDDKLGTFIYYQTVYSYLYSVGVFSSDYKFLIEYKKDKDYIGSLDFYNTMVFRGCIVVLILFIAPFFLIDLNDFAFWPFYVSIIVSLLVSEFVLFINNEKQGLIFFRFLSQTSALVLTILFYYNVFSIYYIATIIMLQNCSLIIASFLLSKKYIVPKLSYDRFLTSFKSFSVKKIIELLGYYSIRHFFLYITTIELFLFSYYNVTEFRNIFAEGLRLSIVLIPFAYFYINFNINKLGSRFYLVITTIALVFVFVSPLTILLFYGEGFIDGIFYFNFFILAFYFNSFVEKEAIDLLTSDSRSKVNLIKLNLLYFVVTTLLMFISIKLLTIDYIIFLFFL